MDEKTRKAYVRVCLISGLAGALGFVLRLLLYRIGMDDKGLLKAWHPLTLGVVLAALAAGAGILACALQLPKKSTCPGPVGPVPAAGSLILGLCLVPFLYLCYQNGANTLVILAGAIAAAAMLAAAFYQLRGRQPYFLLYALVSLFFAVYLVTRYRSWSQNPQMMDYVLVLLGSVMMMLYAFQLAQGSLGQAGKRPLAVYGGLGALLCLAGASGGEAVPLCLGGAIWMLTGLVSGGKA